MPTKLTHEIIAAAILGFEEQKRKIDSQIGETESDDGSCLNSPAATAETPKRKRRKMSVAARKRIAAAQRKRWAESKKQSEAAQRAAKPKAAKPKRKLSTAGRRAIIAATKEAVGGSESGKSKLDAAATAPPHPREISQHKEARWAAPFPPLLQRAVSGGRLKPYRNSRLSLTQSAPVGYL